MSASNSEAADANSAREEVLTVQDQICEANERRLALIRHFEDMINEVLHALYETHLHLQGWSLAEVCLLAEIVRDEIMDTVKRIPIKCREQSHPQTRYEGLSALENIGYLLVCAGENELSIQVRNHFDCISVLERAMLQIVQQMTPAERIAIRDCEDGHGCPLLPRIKYLQALGRVCLLYDNMHWVIDALEGASLSNGEEDLDDTEDVA